MKSINLNNIDMDVPPLRRLGRKSKLVGFLKEHMPVQGKILISLFFGTGAFEFSVFDRISFLYANDLDENVYNFYKVLSDKNLCENLITGLEMLPIGDCTWRDAKSEKTDDKVKKALNFLYLSNFSFLGDNNTINYSASHNKRITLKNIKLFYKSIVSNENVTTYFLNRHYLDVLKCIPIRDRDRDTDRDKTFIFADPPYLGTTDKYPTPNWTEADHVQLQNFLKQCGLDFMLCEFNHPFVVELALKNGFNVIPYETRYVLNTLDKKTEILITNYKTSQFNLF